MFLALESCCTRNVMQNMLQKYLSGRNTCRAHEASLQYFPSMRWITVKSLSQAHLPSKYSQCLRCYWVMAWCTLKVLNSWNHLWCDFIGHIQQTCDTIEAKDEIWLASVNFILGTHYFSCLIRFWRNALRYAMISSFIESTSLHSKNSFSL